MAAERKTTVPWRTGVRLAALTLVLSLLASPYLSFPSCQAYPSNPALPAGPSLLQTSPITPAAWGIPFTSLSELTPHDPILIEGDADFAAQAEAEGWPGNGTPSNPYIIEGYEIDLGGGEGSCIWIQDTRASFIVRGCLLHGANTSTYYKAAGICLWNVSEGVIANNTCTGNLEGILLYGSSYSVVQGNNCTANRNGIRLAWNCTNNTLSHNLCKDNDNGIYLYKADANHLTSNTCTNNSVLGIGLTSSNNNVIIRNTCSNNEEKGMEVDGGWGNLIANNTCSFNGSGLYLDYQGSKPDTINVTWNLFVNNAYRDAWAGGTGANFHHNYYSSYRGPDADQDGIGDDPHTLPGTAQATDPTPLMLPPGHLPVWLQQPEDQILVQGELLHYDLNATAPPPGLDSTSWQVSDSTHFHIDSYGVLTTPASLPVGSYPVTVTVRDTRGNQLSATLTITVTPPPIIPGFPWPAILLALAATLTLGLGRRKTNSQQGEAKCMALENSRDRLGFEREGMGREG